MTDTNLTVVSYRTRDTECLQTDTDSFSSFSSVCAVLLKSDSSTYYISPFCIFKADRLSFFTRFIRIKSGSFESHREVAAAASVAKKQAKKRAREPGTPGGGNVFVERRGAAELAANQLN